jgi:hypothetical protein
MIERACCCLVMAGHSRPWEYGWSFFEVANDELSKREERELKRLAVAVRVGGNADKNQWRRFIE